MTDPRHDTHLIELVTDYIRDVRYQYQPVNYSEHARTIIDLIREHELDASAPYVLPQEEP